MFTYSQFLIGCISTYSHTQAKPNVRFLIVYKHIHTQAKPNVQFLIDV